MQREFVKTVETISKLRLQAVKLERDRAKLGERSNVGRAVHADPVPGSKPRSEVATNVGRAVRAEVASGTCARSEAAVAGVHSTPYEENDAMDGANEANSTAEVQVVFGSEPVGATQTTEKITPNEANRPRPMTRRDKAIARMLKKARAGR